LIARLCRSGADRLGDELGSPRAEAAPREETANGQPGFGLGVEGSDRRNSGSRQLVVQKMGFVTVDR
ncbi:MAG: hypothetical protein WA206_17550, partial [Candidatus Binatus sp.]